MTAALADPFEAAIRRHDQRRQDAAPRPRCRRPARCLAASAGRGLGACAGQQWRRRRWRRRRGETERSQRLLRFVAVSAGGELAWAGSRSQASAPHVGPRPPRHRGDREVLAKRDAAEGVTARDPGTGEQRSHCLRASRSRIVGWYKSEFLDLIARRQIGAASGAGEACRRAGEAQTRSAFRAP